MCQTQVKSEQEDIGLPVLIWWERELVQLNN